MAIVMPHAAQSAVQFGNYEGDARQLTPSAVARQNSDVKYNGYSNSAYGQLILGAKDARKASGDYKTVNFTVEAFNSLNKSAQDQCGRRSRPQDDVFAGDMNRCALEFDMKYRVTNYFEPGKVRLIGEQKFMQTNINKAEYRQFQVRKPAPKNAFATYHMLEYTFLHRDTKVCEYHYQVHAGNVYIHMSSIANGHCNFGEQQQAAYDMANDITAKLPRTGQVDMPVSMEVEEKVPTVENPEFVVEAYPAPSTAQVGRTAYLPASTKLPAKLIAKTKPDTAVTFEIVSGKQAQLQAGAGKGTRLTVKADSNGIAEVLFFYAGTNIKAPLAYEVQITALGRKETVTVNVGLGLAFDRIKAVQADQRDTHAFTLGVKSRFHPKLNLGLYFSDTHNSGIWGGQRIGVYLRTKWVNAPDGATPDEAFFGTALIATTPIGESALIVGKNEAQGEPQYYLTNYMYPAVVMKSDGRHTYQINGGITLLDSHDAKVGYIEEGMQQGQAFVIIARDTPEHWMSSLVCSLESSSMEQYLMLETAKKLPVGGTAVELLTSATGLMCKFGKAEYESLFYDLGTILGSKYLDHLMDPDVFKRLTPKQQTAARLAKKSYDKLDEHKQDQERDKWLSKPYESNQSKSSESFSKSKQNQSDTKKNVDQDLDSNLKDLKKSAEDLKNIFKDIKVF
ncbi:MAG: hypothetical protein Q7S46_09785 [Gallionella sp.]|nr:hypothetical protein [Gallionella sp.]